MVSTLRWYNSPKPWVQIPSKLCAEWLTPPPPALCGHCCWFSLSLFFQEDIIECKKVCAKLAFMFDAFKSKQNYRHSQPPISFQTFFLSLSFVRSFVLSFSFSSENAKKVSTCHLLLFSGDKCYTSSRHLVSKARTFWSCNHCNQMLINVDFLSLQHRYLHLGISP